MKKITIKFINTILAPLHVEVRSVYSSGRMFPESLMQLKRVLTSPSEHTMTVIDVGVADGTPELWSAFPASTYRYLLIEANPVYAERIEVYGKKMNAIVEKVFCGDHDGTESFITDSSYDSGKSSKYARKTGGHEERSTVPCLMLDTILKKHALSGPYVLKIDVEGAELDVLRGATSALTSTEAVIVETPIILRKAAGSHFSEIVSFMHEQGFVVFDFAEMTYHRRSRLLNLTNTIFIRKDNAAWEHLSVLKK